MLSAIRFCLASVKRSICSSTGSGPWFMSRLMNMANNLTVQTACRGSKRPHFPNDLQPAQLLRPAVSAHLRQNLPRYFKAAPGFHKRLLLRFNRFKLDSSG